MSYNRDLGFECDQPNCWGQVGCSDDFHQAKEEMQNAGWEQILKNGVWTHRCPNHGISGRKQ